MHPELTTKPSTERELPTNRQSTLDGPNTIKAIKSKGTAKWHNLFFSLTVNNNDNFKKTKIKDFLLYVYNKNDHDYIKAYA